MSIILPNGYKMTSTFFMDFRIAEGFGPQAVRETYENAFKNWKYNHVYLTEMAIVFSNFSIWHYGKNDELSKLYTELYHTIDEYCMTHLKNDELAFYLKTTD